MPDPKPADADVADELRRGGVAFGDLIRLTGEAVAKTQRQLEITAADTISALATTQVDIIAAEVLTFNENGALTDSETYVQKLPLITIIDPAVYQWEQVRLQGLLFAREFGAATSAETSASSASGSAGVSSGLIFGRAHASFQASTTSTEVETTSSTDLSYGQARMNALLTPRTDTGIPKPRQVTISPSIEMIQGPAGNITGPPENRTKVQELTLIYSRANGERIANQPLSIETEGVPWAFQAGSGPNTDGDGTVVIELTRTYVDAADEATTRDVVVSVRRGMVGRDFPLTL